MARIIATMFLPVTTKSHAVVNDNDEQYFAHVKFIKQFTTVHLIEMHLYNDYN